MVVGAPDDLSGTSGAEGAAFVYTLTSAGMWSNTQTLTGTGTVETFGSAVAISGNTMVIGAPEGGIGAGAAYVFRRSAPGAAWAYSQKLTAATSDGSYFGSAVAIDSNTIVVGASQETPSTGDVYGAAYVYTRPSASAAFSESTGPLTSPQEQIGDYFGNAVAVSGQTVFVGALDETVSSNSEEGSVYAYTEASTADDWDTGVTETTLPPTSGAQSEQFGASLAIQGSMLVVGAEGLKNGTGIYNGAAFVYTVPANGDVTSLAPDATLQPPVGTSVEPFWGGSVAIDGATIVLGSGQDGSAETGDGPYVYTEPNAGWSSSATGSQLPVTPGAGGVSVSGTAVLIGQPGVTAGAGDVISFSQPATQLTLALAPTSIVANGISTSTAIATVTDASGDAATAEDVTFASSDPGVKIGTVTNNGDGTYSATLTSSTTVGTPTITATDSSVTPNISGHATLTQTAESSGGSGGSSGSPSPKPPTAGELRSSLAGVLSPSGKHGTIKAILKADDFVFTYRALEAGKLVIDWYRVPPGAHVTARKKAPKPVLVADGTAKPTKAGAIKIKVKLTAAGKRLFKNSRKLKLTAKVSFMPTGRKPTTSIRTFTLK